MKFLVLSIYLSIFCNPLQAKIRESGIVFGDGFAFSLTAPSGWVLDNHSGNSEGLQAVFYPKGSSWDKSETVMYANIALKKIKGNESVKKVISFDKKKFKIRSAKTRILDGKNILLSNKKQAIVKKFMGIGDKYSNSEAVAYVDSKPVIAILVLASRTSNGFKKNYPQFEKMVKSYRFIAQDVRFKKKKRRTKKRKK
ncbi:MAG: hypothetical protein HN509_17520 [Halobacteriovoraceae bacterium]|nr:hypothetical protein [Halobacteriovoraceae bacterium]